MAYRGRTLTGSQGSRPIGVVAGYMLKVARLAAFVTQEALAESLRVDVSTVQGWESGRRPLSLTSAGELLRLGQHLSRAGAPDSTSSHLHEAICADLILTAGVCSDGDLIDLPTHPLAGTVLRRSIANLVTWPFTETSPPHLSDFSGSDRHRGPVGKAPYLDAGQKDRFFDHLAIVSERARLLGEELLRRQSVYLLGFDDRSSSIGWLRDVHDRSTRRSGKPIGSLHAHLASRSAALALAASGDVEKVHKFVALIDDERTELVNLNYWAHWIGETRWDRAADDFMLADLGTLWTGDHLLFHLLQRIRTDAVHRPLNLQTLHSLISYKPELLARTSADLRICMADRLRELESCSQLSRNERDQTVGLIYALRIARV